MARQVSSSSEAEREGRVRKERKEGRRVREEVAWKDTN